MTAEQDDLVARLDERVGQVLKGVETLTIKVDAIATAHTENRMTLENHDARLSGLESWHTWLLRTVFGVVILGGLALIINISPNIGG